MIKTIIASLTCALALSTPAAAQQSETKLEINTATIQQTEQFRLHSKIVGADFLIQVAKPLAPTPPGQKLPAVYLLDGTYLFGAMTPLARLLPFEKSAQPTYVIGVGFPEEDFMAYGARRNNDLIHIARQQNGRAIGSGGKAFARFIKEELRPLIESRYPIDHNQSVLAGHSLGGLFTTTVLANDPDAFAGYIIGSPSLQFDAALPDKVRAIAAKGHGHRVFIGVGANEGARMITGVDALESAFHAPASAFVVARKTFADETHVSGQGAWMSAGLRYVLPPAPATPAQ